MVEVVLPATKVCIKCKQEKARIDFYTDRKYLQSSCKVCSNSRRKENYHNTPYNPNAKLIQEYGISLEEYNILFSKQEGCCKICGKHQALSKRRLAVDHNHTTGKIRGLLCSHCNLMLGHAKDNLTTLQQAITYLKDNHEI